MTGWSGVAGVAFAVMVAAGCAEGGDGMEGTDEQMAASDTTAQEMLAEPSCQPMSGNMEVEGRASPYDSTSIAVGEGTAKICYGRPSLRGRNMIGGDAVPYDTLWRTGANEPTTIHLNVPATIAGMEVEPGAYTLYTVPREGGEWTLIVNRSTSQWGHESTYTDEVRAQEVGRAPVQVETLDSEVEQLTIRPVGAMAQDGAEEAVGDTATDSSTRQGVVLEWQDSRVHIPIIPAG